MLILAMLACVEAPIPDRDAAVEPCVLEPGGSCIVVGSGVAGFLDEGPATDVHLFMPQDVTVGADGVLYVLDYNNHRVLQVVDGWASGFAGEGFPGDGPEGPAVDAMLNHPTSVALEGGQVFIAGFHSARVYGVANGQLESVAGIGIRGTGGDGGPADEASLDQPSSVAVGDDGTLYIADQGNLVIRQVRGGVIDRFAGTTGVSGYSGDGGPALDAVFGTPTLGYGVPALRIVLDEPLLYVVDESNAAIRVIDLETGIIDTVVGPEAMLVSPSDVAVGPDGALYVLDAGAHCVRAVRDGVLQTWAGTCGAAGSSPEAVPRGEVLFSGPTGIEVDEAGTVFVADFGNHVIRALAP